MNKEELDFFEAIRKRQVPAFLALLQGSEAGDNALVQSRESEQQRTPLHVACQVFHRPMITHLLSRGAPVNSLDRDGNTPLHLLLQEEEVLPLQQGEEDLEGARSDSRRARRKALRRVLLHDSAVELLQAGASVEIINVHGQTPIHLAARLCSVKLLENMLARVDENLPAVLVLSDGQGDTALHGALAARNHYMAWALLEAGAPVNGANHQGRTPLHQACLHNNRETIRCLLERGADPERPDHDGNTPLLLALGQNHLDAAQILVQAGARVQVTNAYGQTPLHYVAAGGWVDWILGLLEVVAGADLKLAQLESQNQAGQTPLSLALENHHFGAVQVLLAATIAAQYPDEDDDDNDKDEPVVDPQQQAPRSW